MTLTLPPGLPAPVFDCVAGHFPRGDETAARRTADYWSDKAEQCRGYADHHVALAARTDNELRGDTGTAIAKNHLDLAEKFRSQADFIDTLVEELYEAANNIENQKWTVIGFATILAWQLARAALMFSPVGAAIEFRIDRMATDTACQVAKRRFMIFLAGQSAKYATQRGTIVLAGKAMFWGAAQIGGISAAVQAGQILAGNRESMDWKSVGIAAAAGGVGGGAGAVAGAWVGGRWIIPSTVARAEAATSTAGRVGFQLAGTSLVGASGGLVGGIFGALTSILLSGQPITTKAITETLIPAITGGFLGAAAHGAAEIRSNTRTPETAVPEVTAPADTAANTGTGQRPLTQALVDALADHGILTRDFDPADPAGSQQQQLNQLVTLLRQPAKDFNTAPAPFMREDYNISIWKPKDPQNPLPDVVNNTHVDEIQHPAAVVVANEAPRLQNVYAPHVAGTPPINTQSPSAPAQSANPQAGDGPVNHAADGGPRPRAADPAASGQRPTPHPADNEPVNLRQHSDEPAAGSQRRHPGDSEPPSARQHPDEPTPQPIRQPDPAPKDPGTSEQPVAVGPRSAQDPAPAPVPHPAEGQSADVRTTDEPASGYPAQQDRPTPDEAAVSDSQRPPGTDGARPHPADNEPADARAHADEPEAQPEPQDGPTPDEALVSSGQHPADSDAADGARPHPADSDAVDGPRSHPADSDADSEQPQPVPAAAAPTGARPADAAAVAARPADAAHPADGGPARSRQDNPAGPQRRGRDRQATPDMGTPRRGGRRRVVAPEIGTPPPDLAIAVPHDQHTNPALVNAFGPDKAGWVAQRPADSPSNRPAVTADADPAATSGRSGTTHDPNATSDHTGAPEVRPEPIDTATDGQRPTQHPADDNPASVHLDEPVGERPAQHNDQAT
ncbi:WXG100-like domain-containing protein, partial [Nocardia pseudovaccinii]|uniref:WXG100-like domain-containing protein n=1 Tax=Nocardia pseudovaccinii TaxID=189540 RepID=UPI000AD376C4